MIRFLPSIISGILMGISQQPWGFGFLAWFSLVPLLFSIENEKTIKGITQQSFLWSFIYHLIFFFWISDNIGLDSQLLRYLIMLLVVLVLTINIFIIYSIYYYIKKYLKFDYIIFSLPIIIVAIEYIRSLGFYGSVWNSLAYTQIDYLTLIQNIEYTGLYGLTFWIVLINVLIYKLITNFNQRYIVALVILFLFPWATGLIINKNYNDAEKIKVKVIQPNISLNEKRQSLKKSLNTMINLSNNTINDSIDLIIWPESSISHSFVKDGFYNKELSFNMNNFLNSSNFSLVAGSDLRLAEKKYNSSILFKSDSVIAMYHKKRLVPNVERTPEIFNKIGLNIGLMNFDIGEELNMFSVNNINFASMICIESVFDSPTREFVKKGAQFITYIVNDGWYPREPQLSQHANRCIYRAIENRRSIIRCANTGISIIVDPYGNITDRIELNKEGVIEAEVIILDEQTFYTKYGNLFSIFNLVIMILMLVVAFFRNLNRK